MGSTEVIDVSDDGESETVRSRISISHASASQVQSIMSSYAAVTPKFDFSALIPAIDTASLMPKLDASLFASITNVQSLLPKLDSMLVPALNIAAVMPKFEVDLVVPTTALANIANIQSTLLASMPDYSKMLGCITSEWIAAIQPKIDLTTSIQPILDMMRSIDWDSITQRRRIPDNWPENIGERLPALIALVNDDGIPAAWVPRSEVLDLLLSATTRDERSEILIRHREDILDDCADWLDSLTDPVLDPVLPTAREAIEACRNSYWKVGAISAVQVVHSIVEWDCCTSR